MTIKQMKAALWYGPYDLRLEEIPIQDPTDHEILIKVSSALTCGTDFKMYQRGHALLAKTIPSRMGHEVSGIIVKKGKSVQNFKEGDLIVAANSAPCSECFYCKNDQENLCDQLEFLNGAFAEYLLIPERIVRKNIYHIPSTANSIHAASAEPLASVVRTAEKIGIKAGNRVGIIGSGPTGLLWVQVAKLYGAEVIALGRNPEKLKKAISVGAHQAHLISEINSDLKIDVMIDAAGQPETWELAVKLVRKGGRVGFYGGCKTGTCITLDTHKLHYEELSLFGTFHHTPHYFEKALNYILEDKIKIEPLIAGQEKLDNIDRIFNKDRSSNPMKFAIIS